MREKRIFLGLVLLASGVVGLALIENQNDVIYPVLVLMVAFYALFPQFNRVTDPQALEMEAFHKETEVKQAQIDRRNYEDLVQRSEFIVQGVAANIEQWALDSKKGKYLVRLKIQKYFKGEASSDLRAEIGVVARHLPEEGKSNIWFLVAEGDMYRSIHRPHWPLWIESDLVKIAEFL